MIRAHLATFPERHAQLAEVLARMAPQVDHLTVVLNEYDAVPQSLSAYANVEAVIPDRDLKDAGKFWAKPAPDDIVFLIDDDLGYPPDYVSATLSHIADCDLDRNVFAYQGNAWINESGHRRVEAYMFRKPLDAITGAGLVGTGTTCVLGRHLPNLAAMEPAAGFVDVRFCAILSARKILPWVLPRPKEWLTSILPRELKANSLYRTVHQSQPGLYMPELMRFATKWPHMGQTYTDFHAPTRAS